MLMDGLNSGGHENLRSLGWIQFHLTRGDSAQNISSILSGEGLDDWKRRVAVGFRPGGME
jgi:hypothetical protein